MYHAQYVQDLNNSTFVPRDCEYLEFWTSSKSGKTSWHAGTLEESQVQQWLIKGSAPPPGPTSCGLRLLFFNTSSREAIRRVNTTRYNYPKSWPFERVTFESLVQTFRLPLQVSQALEPSQSFSRYTLKPEAGQTGGAAFYLRTPRAYGKQGPGKSWTYAASFDPTTRVTTGFVDAHTRKTANVVRDRLKLKASLPIWHPMMVPLILSEIQIESAWQLLLHVVEELGQIEYLSGQHDWDMDEKESRLPAADYHQLTGKLTSNNVRLAHHQSVCSFVLSLVDFIGKELDAFKPTALVNGQAITDWEVQVLVDHNAYLKNWTHCLSIQFTDLQIRTQGMTQAVLNLISQRDSLLNIEVAKDSKSIAAASKHDSTAMKTIAGITLIFFPGTFISTLFAMPLFHWESDTVVNSKFWIYWAFTIPLTLVLVGAWLVWNRWQARLVRKEDKEVRNINASGIIQNERV